MSRLPRIRVAAAAAFIVLAGAAFAASAQQSVRPEVGNPLKAAQGLTKQGKHREALAEIARADAVGGKTAYETLLINQMRGSVAAQAGDNEAAMRSFDAVLASGTLPGTEQQKLLQALAGIAYRAKDYPKAIGYANRYRQSGGGDASIRTVLLQSYFLTNECGAVSRVIGDVEARKPTEEELQILANCHLKQRDTGGYVSAMEKLATHYPKKEYWTDLLNRVQKKPGFSDRLALDVYRLKMATGNITSAADYMEMTQLALQAGIPAEAKGVVEKGYAAGVLGKGAEADRQKRLKDLVDKQLAEAKQARATAEAEAAKAKDGTDLLKIGANYVYEGNADKGIKMMEEGLRKGGLKRPEDAKLQLGEAMIQAGQRGRAVGVLKDVKGTDGTSDLARLWSLLAQR
jgi:outer membrane protein assembly factor BamD (BamD/ComL family)